MNKQLKIIVCAAFIVALSFSLVIPSYAADGAVRPEDTYVKYFADAKANMYDDISITATQYLDTAGEGQDFDDMLKLSKTFRRSDCNVFPDGLGNYAIQLEPFRGNWWYDGQSYNTAGRFEFSVSIPFKSESGEMFDTTKLDDFNVLRHVELIFNMYMVNQSFVTKRGVAVFINTVGSGYVPIRESTYDDTFPGIEDFHIYKNVNIPCNQIKGFVFRFYYAGLPRYDTLFTFTVDHNSYLSVFNEYEFYKESADGLLNNSKDYLDGMMDDGFKFEFPDLSDLDSFWSDIRYSIEGFNLFPYINLRVDTLNVGDYSWVNVISLFSTMSLVIALVSFILFGRK